MTLKSEWINTKKVMCIALGKYICYFSYMGIIISNE